LILYTPNEIGQNGFNQLISAVAIRLSNSQMLSLKLGLIRVFVYLVSKNHQLVVSQLEQVVLTIIEDVDDNGNTTQTTQQLALEFVLTLWLKFHKLFKGTQNKSSAIALSQLFQIANQRLMQLQVSGEKGAKRAERVVPFHVHVIELLLDDYQQEKENGFPKAKKQAKANFEEKEGDDDEDIEEFDEKDLDSFGVVDESRNERNAKDKQKKSPFSLKDDYAYCFLDELLDDQEEEEANNEDIVLPEPFAEINFKEFVKVFFKSFYAQQPDRFVHYANQLLPQHQNLLKEVMI